MLLYGKKESEYHRRLVVIIPIATVLVALLFLTSDVVDYEALEKHLGWEGAVQLLPQITIIPDTDVYEDMRETSRLKTMSSMDVDLIKEKADAEGGDDQPVKSEKKDETQAPELDLSEVVHDPTHTDVSYSEDYVILHMVQPEYPPRELLEGIEGDVTVEILVDEDGHVENAWVLLADGPKAFQEASLEAVRQFRFKPPTENGKPIPMWIRFQVRFRLVS